MKLTKVQITNFQSINDSTEFDIGEVTCLVGKNEAGKTALLKALYRLNPVVETDGEFDPELDYPRKDFSDYDYEVQAGKRQPATVVKATYQLEAPDIEAVEEAYGPGCLTGNPPILVLKKQYDNRRNISDLEVDFGLAKEFLLESADLPQTLAERVKDLESVGEITEILRDAEAQTEASQKVLEILEKIEGRGLANVVHNDILRNRIPKFLYFDEYYQMKGEENVNALRDRVASNALEDSDHPLLGLLDLARLDLERVADSDRTETLIANLESAESRLTEKVLTYWSQNRHLRMNFDIREGLTGDPEGMTQGLNILGRVRDTKHMVSTSLSTRSRGFVWFFSFLAWYSQLRQKGENLLLLLDEPGLSLHAKAQDDLLRYFDEELSPHHQLIYTTHSPFMVDPRRFDRVRIVQDLSIESDEDLPEERQGTKVTTEMQLHSIPVTRPRLRDLSRTLYRPQQILDATPDSLFPLQGALGYEIYQGLFIGPNSLIVEGVSDLLYIQVLSSLLQEMGEEGLDQGWTLTPVGGADKVSTFVALIGAQTNVNVAVLIDYSEERPTSY